MPTQVAGQSHLAEEFPWFHDSLVSSRPSLAPSVTISKPRNKSNFKVRSPLLSMYPNSLGRPHKGARGSRSTTAQYASAIHLDNSAFVAVSCCNISGWLRAPDLRKERINIPIAPLDKRPRYIQVPTESPMQREWRTTKTAKAGSNQSGQKSLTLKMVYIFLSMKRNDRHIQRRFLNTS